MMPSPVLNVVGGGEATSPRSSFNGGTSPSPPLSAGLHNPRAFGTGPLGTLSPSTPPIGLPMHNPNLAPYSVAIPPTYPSGSPGGTSQQLPPACGARQLSKLKRFLTTLMQFGDDISPDTGESVRHLVLALVNSAVSIEEFHAKLQEATNFPLRPFVIPFLKTNLPFLQRELLQCARLARQYPDRYLNFASDVPSNLSPGNLINDSLGPPPPKRPFPSHPSIPQEQHIPPFHGPRQPSSLLYPLPPSLTAGTDLPFSSNVSMTTNVDDNHISTVSQARECESPPPHPFDRKGSLTRPFDRKGPPISLPFDRKESPPPRPFDRKVTPSAEASATKTETRKERPGTNVDQPDKLCRQFKESREEDQSEDFDPESEQEIYYVYHLLSTVSVMMEKARLSLDSIKKRHSLESSVNSTPAHSSPSDKQAPSQPLKDTSESSDSAQDLSRSRLCGPGGGETSRKRASVVGDIERAVTAVEAKASDLILDVERQRANLLKRKSKAASLDSDTVPLSAEASSVGATSADEVTNVEKSGGAISSSVLTSALETVTTTTVSSSYCWNCGREANETCSGCNLAKYCGSFCQHKDWENHHKDCRNLSNADKQKRPLSEPQQDEVDSTTCHSVDANSEKGHNLSMKKEEN